MKRIEVMLLSACERATNAMIGVHTALQDSTPLILFVGLVTRDAKEREALQ